MIATSVRRKSFQPYCEPFRPLNEEERKSFVRIDDNLSESGLESWFSKYVFGAVWDQFQISYQSHLGGFTICNILLNGKLYSGSSCCSRLDNWLPIRGKMLAFRRALESEGVAV